MSTEKVADSISNGVEAVLLSVQVRWREDAKAYIISTRV